MTEDAQIKNDYSGSATVIEYTKIENRYKSVRTFIWACFAAFGVYQSRLTFEALAGKHTTLSVITEFLFSYGSGITITIQLSVISLLIIAYIRERRLREKTTERLHARIKELELQHDPERSTSGLTTRGRTRPEDQ